MMQMDLLAGFAAFAPPPPPPPAPIAAPRTNVVYLVGCGKSKLDKTARAKDLYTGNLFRAAREHAERNGSTWRILSAMYGALEPERRIKPYNRKLGRRERDVECWAKSAATDLTALGKLGKFEVVCLAGGDYARPICAELRSRGIRCTMPLEGLGVGQRLAWFKANRQEAGV